MSFGGDCLINKINQQIASLQSSTYESSQLAGSARSSLEKSYCCVTNISDLPPAACNEGRFIYVTSCRSFRYSDGYEWLMNACSALGNVNQVNQLWTWGRNNIGQLGDGTTVDRCSPGTVTGCGANWCQISGGRCHSAAIKTDGTLWTWGRNQYGQLGDGSTLARCSPGTVAGGGTNWCGVSAGENTPVAIKTDGTLWTWGSNVSGVLGNGTTVSRCSPGTTWGNYTTWCQVSSGSSSVGAIKTDGTLWTWGGNGFGGLGDGTLTSRRSPGTVAGGGTDWCQVSIGTANAGAIKCDGTLWTWGINGNSSQGRLGDGTTLDRSSPGTVAGGGTNWIKSHMSPFSASSAAIKCDGTLWTWGASTCGSLGDGNILPKSSPGTVAGGGTNWCQIFMGNDNTVAVKTDGTLWTWGRSCFGGLGRGTTVTRCSPGNVAGGGINWCQAVSSAYFMAALKTRGF